MITATRPSPCRTDFSGREIVARYLGVGRFPCRIRSPLREGDNEPSLAMRERDGTVFWKDFGTGEGGDALSLMARLWNTDRNGAARTIEADMARDVPDPGLVRDCSATVRSAGGWSVDVVTRPWDGRDREYWGSFGITETFARWCDVHPVSHAVFSRETREGTVRRLKRLGPLAYAYFEHKDGKGTAKVYQPFSKTMKWVSGHGGSVWDLWVQASVWGDRYGRGRLIVTSSRKDAMCLWSVLGVPAVALQGEGVLPKPRVMDGLLEEWDGVFLWYDTDAAGIADSARLVSLYPRLRNVRIPVEYGCKDPSDLVRDRGADALRKVWEDAALKRHPLAYKTDFQ